MLSRDAIYRRRRNPRSAKSDKFRRMRAKREEREVPAEVGWGVIVEGGEEEGRLGEEEGGMGEGGVGEGEREGWEKGRGRGGRRGRGRVGRRGRGRGGRRGRGRDGRGRGGRRGRGRDGRGRGRDGRGRGGRRGRGRVRDGRGGREGVIEAGEGEGGEEGGITSSDNEPETPLGKRKQCPECEFLPTPVRRKLLTEDPAMATAFVGDTSHIQKFVDQMNCTSKCSSPGCSGQLAIVRKKAQGLGGTIEVTYQCSGCVARSLTFSTSVAGEV